MRALLTIALAGFFTAGAAGSTGAATLSYTGSLTFGISGLPTASGGGGGVYVGPTHIATMAFGPAQFGPITTSLPVTSSVTIWSVRMTGVGNLTGTLTGLSAGPPGGGPMGLSGVAKICVILTDCQANIPDADVPRSRYADHAARPVDDRPASHDDPHCRQRGHHAEPAGRHPVSILWNGDELGGAADGDGHEGLHQPDGRVPGGSGVLDSESALLRRYADHDDNVASREEGDAVSQGKEHHLGRNQRCPCASQSRRHARPLPLGHRREA